MGTNFQNTNVDQSIKISEGKNCRQAVVAKSIETSEGVGGGGGGGNKQKNVYKMQDQK